MRVEERVRGDVDGVGRPAIASLRVGVAVVDCDLLVKLWSREAEDLWALREGEVLLMEDWHGSDAHAAA